MRRVGIVLVAAVLAGCSTSGGGDHNGPAAGACPSFGSLSAASAAAPPAATGSVLLRNVQVQASACTDEIGFLFWKGRPGWTVGYRSAPLTRDPSGQTAAVAGRSYLVVRMSPASGVDLSVTPPSPSYDGPSEFRPGAPSAVAEIDRLGDFEGVETWVIGLPDQRRFEVVARPDQLVVRIAAPRARPTRCATETAGVHITYPGNWFSELSPRWSCRYFDPAPFVVFPATDAFSWDVTAQAADAPAATVVARTVGGGSVSSRRTEVAGLPTTVLDVVAPADGLVPAGYRYRMYVLATTPNSFVISGRPAPAGPSSQRVTAEVDRIATAVTAPG